MIDAALQRGLGLTATTADLTDVSADLFDPGLITAADRGHDTPLYTLRYNPDQPRHRLLGRPRLATPQNPQNPARRNPRTDRAARRRRTASSPPNATAAHPPNATSCAGTSTPSTTPTCAATARSTASPGSTPTTHPGTPRPTPRRRRNRAGAQAKANPGRPYPGPVPDELADQWDTAAWEAPAPYKKRRHLDGGMRHDPGWALVAALEIFDEDTGQARKAPIFSTDLLTARPDRTTADSPEEALAMSLDRAQRVDIDLIAALLEVPAADARDLIAGLVYPSLDDPDELVPAVTALSGNVRAKTRRAPSRPPHTDPIYSDYVHALREVLPAHREAEDIKVRPGAPWIPATCVAHSPKPPSAQPESPPNTSPDAGSSTVAQLQAPRPAHDRRPGGWTGAAATPSACSRPLCNSEASSSTTTTASSTPKPRSPRRPK